jgi:gamma-glutamylcysteine synthetase
LQQRYKRSEFFDKYYSEIFGNLNAAQMIVAVLIFRHCDSMRKRNIDCVEIQAHRPYSQYFLSYMMGKKLLRQMNIFLEQLTHINFRETYQCLLENKELFYHESELQMAEILKDYFNQNNLEEIDGRTMAAAFRRFDILLRYLNA